MRQRAKVSPAMGVAFVALAVAIGGSAFAAIPGEKGVVTGCYAKRDGVKQLTRPIDGLTRIATATGELRIVDENEGCHSGEARIDLNDTARSAAAVVSTNHANGVHVTNNNKYYTVVSIPVESGQSTYVSGLVRLDMGGAVTMDGSSTCFLFGPDGVQIPESGGSASGSGVKFTVGNHVYATIPVAGLVVAPDSDGNVEARCAVAYGKGAGTYATAAGNLSSIKAF